MATMFFGVDGQDANAPRWEPRDGQWVAFSGRIPGSHHTRAGKVVGIFCRSGMQAGVVLNGVATPCWAPAHVVVVDHDGGNVLVERHGQLVEVHIHTSRIHDLEPVTNANDIPEKRRPNYHPPAYKLPAAPMPALHLVAA